MKKLIMAIAVVVALGAQAGVVKWNSGTLQGATSVTDGTLSGSSPGFLVNAIVWESTSALSFSAGDLYDAYEKGTTDSLFSGANVYTGSGSSSANVVGTSSYANGTDIYGAILYTYTDAADNVYYIENSYTGKAKSAALNVSNLSLIQGGGTSGTATSWTIIPAAPEPTSGLLMLVGLGALALRRRRA